MALIAFTSNRDHDGPSEDFATMNTEIYTMAASGDDIVRITNHRGVDLHPPTASPRILTSPGLGAATPGNRRCSG